MRTQFRRHWFQRLWVTPVFSFCFFLYFGFHSWYGDYGIDATVALNLQRAELARELASLREQRQHLESRVRLLSDGAVEADMLDERARALLNVARHDEIVYFH